jgi:hypothetical protein
MDLHIKTCDNKYLTHRFEKEEYVINIKRFLRETLGTDIDNMFYMKLSKGNLILEDSNKIGEVLNNNDNINFSYRLLCGPKLIKTEKIHVMINSEDFRIPILKKKFSPAQQIKQIIKFALEKMFDFKKHNFIVSDFELTHNGKILNPERQLGTYGEISRSFIQFNNQEEILSNNKLKGVLLKSGSYYHVYTIGEKIKNDIILVLSKKNSPSENFYEDSLVKCFKCRNIASCATLLPCCRNYCCEVCEKLFLSNKTCLFCGHNFDFF